MAEEQKTLGPYLKSLREERNITLHHMAQVTKINATQLELLENNCFDKLPKKTYVIGHIKAYAKILNIPVDPILKLLDETLGERPLASPPPIQKIAIKEASTKATVSKTPPIPSLPNKEEKIPIIQIIFGLTFTLIITFAVLFVVRQNNQNKELESTNNVELLKEDPGYLQENISSSVSIRPVITPPATPSLEEGILPLATPSLEEASSTNEAHDSSASNDSEATEEKTKEETLKFRKAPLKFFNIITNNEDLEDFYPSSVTARDGLENVVIRSRNEKVWITHKIDDEPVRQFFLKENSWVHLSGKIIRMFMGNANSATVFYNKAPLDLLTTREVKSLIFPEKEGARFYLPLFIFSKDGKVTTSDDYIKENNIAVP